ncbi:MAG: hypothetical protein RBR68_14670 [Tenuifilaceae bacterium]|nr:hypothetical protein [Tenuifilaceae bacterium]
MKTVNVIKTLMIVSLAALITSCSKDDNLKNRTAIKFQSTNQSTRSANIKNTLADGLVLESFKINISEIEIEFDESDPLFATDSVATDYELKGPFEIDLMKDGNALGTTIVSNVELPVAAYDEIEFEFDKNKNANSEMFGKTIIIKGTINGTPFIFWTDDEIEMEIEFDEVVSLDDATSAMLTVSFDLAALFNPAVGVDITSATDGNEDGIIEISPEDPDGNNDLADLIWDKIKYIIEAFEDKYDK